MNDSKWPAYPVGNERSIFALGVAGIKYAELESSFIFIFGTTLDISIDLATKIYARAGREACIRLIEQILPPSDVIGPPTRAVTDIRYFVDGFQICGLNRDHLMHSTIVPSHNGEGTLLYKTSKQGKTIISLQTIEKLRQVADDMHAYLNYGRALGNTINARAGLGVPLFSPFAFPWPDRPPLPHKLDYTSDPTPL